MNDDQEEQVNGSGIMQHNDIREIVNRYVGAVKMFDSVMDSNQAINNMIKPISAGLGIEFGALSTYGRSSSTITRDTFKKELQKSSWRSVFNKMNMQKYVTSNVMSDINKFVEQQQNIPFTMKNIYKMVEIIVGTHSGRMDQVLVDAFDRICSLSYDNSEAGEKWKTNSDYKINKRFIDNYITEYDKRWPTDTVRISIFRRRSSETLIDDVVKALCFITGKRYEEVMKPHYHTDYSSSVNDLHTFFNCNKIPWGQWAKWNDFFKVRGYKKGTMHYEFLSEDVWMEFNRRVAKIKGWAIPKKTDKKKKGTERKKQTGVEIFN
jgi:hypothetical protein